jgi:hypothetical protein
VPKTLLACHHQQYDKIYISYSFKDPTKKGLSASEKRQHILEERSWRKQLGHKTINVTYPDNTPFDWAFDNFYDAKDFVRHLTNRDGKVAIFGGIGFKPFSNQTTKWDESSMLGNLLWIICIDTTKNGTEDSFPLQAHLAFANKIAQAIISQNIWQEGGIDVVGVSLNESQVADLRAHFHTNTFDIAREAIFQEAIKSGQRWGGKSDLISFKVP